MKGRKPKPTQLRIIQGNPEHRPLPKDEPHLDVYLPEPPEHLSAAAREHWAEVGRILRDAGIITRMDITAFAAYCELYARWVDANNKIRDYGIVIKGKNGEPVQSPYFRISAITFDQMKALLVEFGMTPSSRTRVKGKTKEAENPFATLSRLKKGE